MEISGILKNIKGENQMNGLEPLTVQSVICELLLRSYEDELKVNKTLALVVFDMAQRVAKAVKDLNHFTESDMFILRRQLQKTEQHQNAIVKHYLNAFLNPSDIIVIDSKLIDSVVDEIKKKDSIETPSKKEQFEDVTQQG